MGTERQRPSKLVGARQGVPGRAPAMPSPNKVLPLYMLDVPKPVL